MFFPCKDLDWKLLGTVTSEKRQGTEIRGFAGDIFSPGGIQ